MIREHNEQERYLICTGCGKQDATVTARTCGYSADVNNDPNDWEIVCDDCEYQHCQDI